MAAYAVCWLAAVVLPPVALVRWRETRLAALDGADAQEAWDRFRADMRAESEGAGPVRRKVPRSPEPPERVWLRDYPFVVAAAWVLFVGLLGAVFGLLLSGATRGDVPRPQTPDGAVSDRGSAGP